jgi:hypothetical protein
MGIWIQKQADGNLYGVSGGAQDITKASAFVDGVYSCSVMRGTTCVAYYTGETEAAAKAKAQQWIDWFAAKINAGGIGEVIIDDSDF